MQLTVPRELCLQKNKLPRHCMERRDHALQSHTRTVRPRSSPRHTGPPLTLASTTTHSWHHSPAPRDPRQQARSHLTGHPESAANHEDEVLHSKRPPLVVPPHKTRLPPQSPARLTASVVQCPCSQTVQLCATPSPGHQSTDSPPRCSSRWHEPKNVSNEQ